MKVIIFANGELGARETAVRIADESDLVIAADGGLRHCFELNIKPDILIGDFDSILPELIAKAAATGTEIIRHPKDKDKTDLELALDLSMLKGAKETHLFGVLGNRWDMSLANLLLIAAPFYAGMQITIIDEQAMIYLLRDGDKKEIVHTCGKRISLIPVQNDVQVTLQGVKYPLTSGRIGFSSTRGISNSLTGDRGGIVVEEGVLLCVQSQEKD